MFRYILESSLLEYSMNVQLSESILAASCLTLAFKIKGIEGWEQTLEWYSGYTISQLSPTVHKLLDMLNKPHKVIYSRFTLPQIINY